MEIKAGDVFIAATGSPLSPITNWFQKLWSRDNTSKYCHAGVIIDDEGTTLEAKWTISRHNFMETYKDKRVLIARPVMHYQDIQTPYNIETSASDTVKGINDIIPFEGQWFPVHRMILHALHLAKFIHWHSVVCSELVAKYLYAVGSRHNYWWGTDVDTLEEELKRWKQYVVIYEGKL